VSEQKHNDRLLTDVLGEGVAADFRAGLLDQTLRLARRRRHFRQVRAAAPALAVLAALALMVVWHRIPAGRRSASLPAKPYTLVRTQPLPAAAWVMTSPLSPARLISSASSGSIVLTATSDARARQLNDDELLALVPRPAALVRRGPHSAELVFVNQEDREALLRN
jgi:hypothetical protein